MLACCRSEVDRCSQRGTRVRTSLARRAALEATLHDRGRTYRYQLPRQSLNSESTLLAYQSCPVVQAWAQFDRLRILFRCTACTLRSRTFPCKSAHILEAWHRNGRGALVSTQFESPLDYLKLMVVQIRPLQLLVRLLPWVLFLLSVSVF